MTRRPFNRPTWLRLAPEDEGPVYAFVVIVVLLLLLAARYAPAVDEVFPAPAPASGGR